MAGIYIHIPFCKQACHYCDFHFSTSLKLKEDFLNVLIQEIVSRKSEIQESVETIYFGGGTPSILEVDELKKIIDIIYENYDVVSHAEITIEANPDDLTSHKVNEFRKTSINRFSIGVQSFIDKDLEYMNRAHTSQLAETSIKRVQDAGFENITVDFIYGTPTLSDEDWNRNLMKAIHLSISHISSYALTVEKNTALDSFIQKKKLPQVDEEKVRAHFYILHDVLTSCNYQHYEISNFALEGKESKHNSSYWKGKSYLGFGPSAHSYDGLDTRRWNVSNNIKYIKSVIENKMYFEVEKLSFENQFNEFIMTKLRLKEGVNLHEMEMKFGYDVQKDFLKKVSTLNPIYYFLNNSHCYLSLDGKIMLDSLLVKLMI